MNDETAEKIAHLFDALAGDTKAKFLALNMNQTQGNVVLGRLKNLVSDQHQAIANAALARKAAVEAM